MTLTRGLDVSHWQGVVDWRALKTTHRLGWGAAKATEGASYTDPTFARNWANLRTAGLVRVAYHFARPGQSAAAQARRFVQTVRPAKGDVLCLDLEQSDGRTQGQVNAWAKAFGDELRRLAPHAATILYAGAGYTSTATGRGLAGHFDYWWYPRYPSAKPTSSWPGTFAPRLPGNTTGWVRPHIWQWTSQLRTTHGSNDANVSTLTASLLASGPLPVVPPAGHATTKPATSSAPADRPATPTKGDPVLKPLNPAWADDRKPAPLTSGKWRTLPARTLNGKGTPSVLTGPALVLGSITAYLVDVPTGTTAQARAVIVELKAGKWAVVRELPFAEQPGSAGTTPITVPAGCYLKAGQRLRVQANSAGAARKVQNNLAVQKG